MSPELAQAIITSSKRLGIDPVDLGTAISYETGSKFDPGLWGGKNNNYLGLIQFGPEERAKYGVKPGQSAVEQMGAVENFLRDRGVRPGMGMMDIYSTINAGSPGLYNRSDTANGGAPGTVADKVNTQMAEHRRNVVGYLNGGAPTQPVPQDPTSPIDPTVTGAAAASAPLSLTAPVGALAPPTTASILQTAGKQFQGMPGGQGGGQGAPQPPAQPQFMQLQPIQMAQANPQAQAMAAQVAKLYGYG
jgi:hypothetical protein